MLGAGFGGTEYGIIGPGGGFWAAARLCLCLVLVLVIGLAGECSGRVVVVVANRVVLGDIDSPQLKNIERMMREGAVGLVCPNCAGPKNEYSVMMTAACGSACAGGTENREFYGLNELTGDGMFAWELYGTGTGYSAPDGSIVFLRLGAAQRRNTEMGRGPVTLGACGEALNDQGIRTCLIGGADLPNRLDRSAGVLAMDSRGVIDCGSVSAGYQGKSAGGWPGTLLSDVDALTRAVERYASEAEYIVVSFGDTTRLDELMPDISESAYRKYKTDALRNLDRLMGELMGAANLNGASIVLVSFSPSLQGKWRQPTPVVMWPAGKSAMLTSGTTRTPGFVAASDFAPTVLGLLGVDPPGGMVGRPMYESERLMGAAKLAFLRDAEKRVAANRVLYMPVLLVMAFLGALLFTVVGLLAALSKTVTPKTENWLRFGLLVSASWPLGMLLAVLFPAGEANYGLATAAVAVVLAGSAMVSGRGRGRLAPVMVVFALTVGVLMADAFTGCRLCSFALPGSSQITAMRFYGIGNEYAGIMVSMAACLSMFGAGQARRWVVPVLGGAVVVLFAMGGWGANYGAAVASTVTFGLMWAGLRRGGFGARHVGLALLAGFALVCALAYIDLRLSGIMASHAGRATGLVQSVGVDYVLAVVFRKVLLNLRHMGLDHTAWVVMAFVPFLGLWFWGVQGKVMGRLAGDKAVAVGLKAVLVGAGAAFLFNDSGIVMSSIMLSITVLVLIYSLLGKQEDADWREQ